MIHRPRLSRSARRSEDEFHSFVGGSEAESLVEAVGAGAGLGAADAVSGGPELVGGQQAHDPGHIAGLGTPENDAILT